MNYKKGFSLSEILITLSIIGVVASLTVPALVMDYRKNTYASAIRKFTVNFTEALDVYMLEQGKKRFDQTEIATDAYLGVFNFMQKNFKVAKRCEKSSNCFYSGEYRAIDGSNSMKMADYCGEESITYDKYGEPTESAGNKFVLTDGSVVCIMAYKIINFTTDVYVDINGPKGPNIGGRDLFKFSVTPDRAPHIFDQSADLCGSDAFGQGCIEYLETNNWKMSY